MTRTGFMVAAAGLLLTACSQQDNGETSASATAAAASGTVGAAVAGSTDHRKLTAALKDTQLSSVLDGKGGYTILAPRDAAFDALGDKGTALAGEEQRPLLTAVLRGHILPGEVTPKAIEAAIARKQGPVEMRTMAGSTVRFAKAGNGYTVSNGAETAALGPGSSASNGAVLPIDKVLLPAQ